MRELTRILTLTFCCVISSASLLFAQERIWDQEKSIEMVNQVLATENNGTAWDRIEWMTDVEAAIAKAQKEKKPIFVYWYVKKVESEKKVNSKTGSGKPEEKGKVLC